MFKRSGLAVQYRIQFLKLIRYPVLPVEAALAEQKRTFETLLDVQLKAFQACLTTMMDSTNNRIDSFVKVMTRELTELKASVQFSQTELQR